MHALLVNFFCKLVAHVAERRQLVNWTRCGLTPSGQEGAVIAWLDDDDKVRSFELWLEGRHVVIEDPWGGRRGFSSVEQLENTPVRAWLSDVLPD